MRQDEDIGDSKDDEGVFFKSFSCSDSGLSGRRPSFCRVSGSSSSSTDMVLVVVDDVRFSSSFWKEREHCYCFGRLCGGTYCDAGG